PPYPRAPGARDHRAEGREVSGRVVERLRREGLLPLHPRRDTAFMRDAAHRLNDAVESSPLPPGPDVAIGAHRDVDEARPDLRQRLGGKPARREGAGTIRLADDVRLPHEGPQPLDVIRAAKV